MSLTSGWDAAGTATIAHRPAHDPMPAAQRDMLVATATFGQACTDNMVSIQWDPERHWHQAEMVPLRPFEMHPASAGLHYGQVVFEGLKAYRRVDGSIAAFRPEQNARRLQSSARRLVMPELPEELFLEAVDALVRQDRDWVPREFGRSLYLRPLLIATERGFALRPAREYRFLLLASPMGSFFGNVAQPVTVWVSDEYVRAAVGGTGEAKCAGNYAAGLIGQQQASAMGCDQVVWLDAVERRYVEEMGGMNLFFVYGAGDNARLVTPVLTGTLLPGVVRDSVLTLAQDLGLPTEERLVSLQEWRDGAADGSISETFACGTAAVITPVGEVRAAHGAWTVADGKEGPLTRRLRQALFDLQHGRAADRHGWMRQICGPDQRSPGLEPSRIITSN